MAITVWLLLPFLASYLLHVQGLPWENTCPSVCSCKWYSNKKVADCQEAEFTNIPTKLSPEIQVLDLTNNRIGELFNNAFKKVNLVNLNVLTLTKNEISDIDPDAFNDLKLLLDLDLSYNRIYKLHPKTFSGMEKMRKLKLSGNQLTRLEAYQFPALPNLQHLVIDECQLTYINSLAFNNLPNLNSVNLKSNSLMTVQRELFSSHAALKAVSLADNKWVCDCHLRSIVGWIQEKQLGETQLACYSPERVAGKRWLKLDGNSDLSCPPKMYIPGENIYISPGSNATLSCGASGVPLPRIWWIRDGLVIGDTTKLRSVDPQINFYLTDEFSGGIHWLNLTIEYSSNELMAYEPSVNYKCKVENPAQLKEGNITLLLQAEVPLPSDSADSVNVYLIIAIISVSLLVILVITIFIFCICRRKTRRSKTQMSEPPLAARNNILIVNPVEKPPRKMQQYEKLPQVECELTDLSNASHKSFEEMNYPEERTARVRAPLTALEEEEFDQSSQKLLDISGITSTTSEFSHYPDLLEKVRLPPRAISPTEVSYHSLNNQMLSTSPEWRFSYVYPSEYSPEKYQPVHSNLGQRPCYMTLPRRPRSSSYSSGTMNMPRGIKAPGKYDPIYDTLGPRTTADGTSHTDLSLLTPLSLSDQRHSPSKLSNNNTLPQHYIPLPEEQEEMTLPESISTLPNTALSHLNQSTTADPLADLSPRKRAFLSVVRPPTVEHVQSRPVPTAASPPPLLNSTPNPALFDVSQTPKKKVPPKPPPKPANKRLSISSTNSDVASRLSSVGSERGGGGTAAAIVNGNDSYQDEGPDGTEV